MLFRISSRIAPATGWYLAAALFSPGFAGLPPDLPGEEISHEQVNMSIPRDTTKQELSVTQTGTGLPWLDKAQKTWDAPPLAEQMAGGDNFIPMGKGGIFVPRLSSEGTSPDINIRDAKGRLVASGNAGTTFRVEPGMYTVILGSGTHSQRMIRTVSVEEGKTVPVIPEWSALTVETVDSMAIPFRGEYELVRIDEFETYGRGFGANPDLGEVVKSWVLKPGTYKILGIGQGFNSLTNFVTVRLVPGELCRVLLVQDSITYRILGGGTVEVTPRSRLTSHWKYGANIGGNIKFNSEINRAAKDTSASTLFGLLSTVWLTYDRNPTEWQTRARLDEGFNFTGFNFGDPKTDADDFLLNSLFIWRILTWFGPYARAELRTTFLPRQSIRDESNPSFCILDQDYYADAPIPLFDSNRSFRSDPSFSPTIIDAGIGANADVFNFPFLETRLRAGFGSSYSYLPERYAITDSTRVKWHDSLMRDRYLQQVNRSVILFTEKATTDFGFGPQASISGMLRIGRMVTADAELKLFAPVAPEQRLTRPDFDIIANVSWRLSHWITLDYTYIYLLKQPDNKEARIDKSTHGIWLRFSFTSR
jgi:hypothetical protein